jgi:hypothetical protein
MLMESYSTVKDSDLNCMTTENIQNEVKKKRQNYKIINF